MKINAAYAINFMPLLNMQINAAYAINFTPLLNMQINAAYAINSIRCIFLNFSAHKMIDTMTHLAGVTVPVGKSSSDSVEGSARPLAPAARAGVGGGVDMLVRGPRGAARAAPA